ncbi:MAG: alpha/beta fold hydrolase [bacterium]
MHLFISLLISASILSGCSTWKSLEREEVVEKYANAKDGSEFIEVQGMQVHVRDQGRKTAPTLVLIHGISDSLHTWDYWAHELAQTYRVVRFDVPGFGLTKDVESEEFTPKFYSDFMLALLTKMKITKATMIGNSLGGFISWNFALAYPDRVSSLVLLDPAAYPLTPPWIVRIASSPFRIFAENINLRFMTKDVAQDVFFDDEKLKEEVVDRYHAMFSLEGAPKRYMDVFASINKFSDQMPQGIEQLEHPVLLLWGEKDEWISPAQIELWKKDVKNVSAVILPNVGHAPQEEAPEQSLSAARDFIKTYSK